MFCFLPLVCLQKELRVDAQAVCTCVICPNNITPPPFLGKGEVTECFLCKWRWGHAVTFAFTSTASVLAGPERVAKCTDENRCRFYFVTQTPSASKNSGVFCAEVTQFWVLCALVKWATPCSSKDESIQRVLLSFRCSTALGNLFS